MLTKALSCVLNTLRDKDDALIQTTGIRRFFVVNGYEEVADFLQRKGIRAQEDLQNLYMNYKKLLHLVMQQQ